MNLYLLLRPEGRARWDEAQGFVICAPSEQDARNTAALRTGDEGPAPWLDFTLSSCTLLGTSLPHYTESSIILRDFKAG